MEWNGGGGGPFFLFCCSSVLMDKIYDGEIIVMCMEDILYVMLLLVL